MEEELHQSTDGARQWSIAEASAWIAQRTGIPDDTAFSELWARLVAGDLWLTATDRDDNRVFVATAELKSFRLSADKETLSSSGVAPHETLSQPRLDAATVMDLWPSAVTKEFLASILREPFWSLADVLSWVASRDARGVAKSRKHHGEEWALTAWPRRHGGEYRAGNLDDLWRALSAEMAMGLTAFATRRHKRRLAAHEDSFPGLIFPDSPGAALAYRPEFQAGQISLIPADRPLLSAWLEWTDLHFKRESVMDRFPLHIEPLRSPPAPRGRRPKYDWEGFEREAVQRMEGNGDFDPSVDQNWVQARLEEQMMDWCQLTWESTPSESQIRLHVRTAAMKFREGRKGL